MQTACLNLKCPGLLILRQAQDSIYRGSHYECVYCHTHYPAAMIEAMEALPLDTLVDDDEGAQELRMVITASDPDSIVGTGDAP